MVVAVRGLRLAARVDDVDLRRDLVGRARATPSRDQRDDVVGVVVDEHLGVAHGELLQRVPHPVVGAGLGEVVARGGAARLLLGDQRVEGRGRPVDDGDVGERALEDDDARARRSARAPARPGPRGGLRRRGRGRGAAVS